MRFDVITLFPELFESFFEHGINRRAFESKQVDVRLWNPRDFADGNYRRVDDRPFGGGPGMVMMAEPLWRCLQAIRAERAEPVGALAPVVLLAPALPLSPSLPQDAWHWTILLSLGVYGAVGHWFLIKAYRIATASALAPYPYLQMVWMIAAGWLVFGQLPDGWTIGGAAIIVASGLYIMHREHRLRLRKSAAPKAEEEELAKKL